MAKIRILVVLWCSVLMSLAYVRWQKSRPLPPAPEEEGLFAMEEDTPLPQDTLPVPLPENPEHPTSPVSPASPVLPASPLSRFHAALEQAGEQAVRVMHYGDSQIEEDRITSVLRRHLQSLYGGGGVGLLPLHQTIPTRSLRQRLYMNGEQQSIAAGPQRYLVYGPKSWRRDTCLYGPMGQVAMMDDQLVSGSEDLYLELTPLKGTRPHQHIRVWADSTIRYDRDSMDLHLYGHGAVYAISMETDTGVIVDNIPMRGSLGTVFTDIDSTQLWQFYQTTHVRLIILQYGGNFLSRAKTEQGIQSAVYGLRDQVRLLKRLAPEADILFVGPSDMLINDNGTLVTNPLVSYMDERLAAMAEREKILYFSLFRSMGGEGSMLRWQENGWAGADGVHFTPKGADRAGEMIWEAIAP